jgi:hypothetical protein
MEASRYHRFQCVDNVQGFEVINLHGDGAEHRCLASDVAVPDTLVHCSRVTD